MYRVNKPGWRIVLYFARLLEHPFHLITERFLCGSIILTVRPNTACTVKNKTCQKRFVERSLNLEISHYAAASRRNCDTHTHSVYTTWRRVMLRQPAWRHWKPMYSLSLNLHSLVTPTFSLLKFVPGKAARLPALVINDDITNIHNYCATYPSVV